MEIGSHRMLVHDWLMTADLQDLADRTILVTRAGNQASETGRAIARRGGVPLYLPCLELSRLDQTIRQSLPLLQQKGMTVLFSSGNGVHAVAETLGNAFSMLLRPHRIIAIGDKTASALADYDLKADLVPETASQAGLVDYFRRAAVPEQLLFYRAEEGSDLLSKELTTLGCNVTTIFAYRTICPHDDASEMIEKIEHGEVDAVLLGSPKTALNYLQRIADPVTANRPAIVVISDQVAEIAGHAGLQVQAVAKKASFDAMLDALASYFTSTGV